MYKTERTIAARWLLLGCLAGAAFTLTGCDKATPEPAALDSGASVAGADGGHFHRQHLFR